MRREAENPAAFFQGEFPLTELTFRGTAWSFDRDVKLLLLVGNFKMTFVSSRSNKINPEGIFCFTDIDCRTLQERVMNEWPAALAGEVGNGVAHNDGLVSCLLIALLAISATGNHGAI